MFDTLFCQILIIKKVYGFYTLTLQEQDLSCVGMSKIVSNYNKYNY